MGELLPTGTSQSGLTRAVDAHAIRRLRQWLCRKHKVRAGKYVRYPDKRLWEDLGLARLAQRTARFPWAKA